MSIGLSEYGAVREFLEIETPLLRAMKMFCAEQRERYQDDCSSYMATVPRDPERASDCAARASAYETFWLELKHFADANRP